MTRSLRILTPKLQQLGDQGQIQDATAMFWWGVFAILLQIVLPYVVLEAMGVDSAKLKEHPATYLVLVCGAYSLLRGFVPFQRRCREAPGLLLFVFAVPVLNIYSAWLTGISGAALYAESYWSAGMLALMLAPASPRQRRLLAIILITACVLNVLIGLCESLTATNWFPILIDPDNVMVSDMSTDFRANALYNHPLQASLITSMGVFLLFAMKPRVIVSGPIFALLVVGLLAFGGRTALGVTLIVTSLTTVYLLFSGILQRNLKLEFVVGIVVAAIVLPILIGIVVTQTSIADRIMDTLYYDGSAQTRATQLEIFQHLSLRNWLFGISHDDLNLLKYQIGLGGKETDIENFWILMLLNLGSIGFAVFLFVFGTFLFYLGRYTNSMYGWLLIISALVIDSGSNSLGSKSSDLFFEVAFLVAISGYTDYVRSPRKVLRLSAMPSLGFARAQSVLAKVAPSKLRGLRISGSRSI